MRCAVLIYVRKMSECFMLGIQTMTWPCTVLHLTFIWLWIFHCFNEQIVILGWFFHIDESKAICGV